MDFISRNKVIFKNKTQRYNTNENSLEKKKEKNKSSLKKK